MTFDELWRLNLAQENGPVDSVFKPDEVGSHTISIQNYNELLLTTDDRVLLSQMGIKL
jgi:hypothetical protein